MYIKPKSETRIRYDVIYRRICQEIKRELIKKNEFCCFFSGLSMTDDFIPVFHHLGGRTGTKDGIHLYIYKPWIVPAYASYHQKYHDFSVKELLGAGRWWYSQFLERLRLKDIELYNKELVRIEKSIL